MSTRTPTIVVPVVVVLLLTAYVLSIGPAYRYLNLGSPRRGYIFGIVYAPILWLYDRSETVKVLVSDWCGRWE